MSTLERPPASAAALTVTGLRVLAGDAPAAVPLVADASFVVRRGETVAIVGESGSGKTMTARALVDLLPPSVHAEGQVAFGGTELLAGGEDRLRRVRGSGIGLLLQDPHTMLNPLARAGDQIIDGLRLAHPEWSRAQLRRDAVARLEEVGIADASVAERLVFQLSGGMKQRVAMAAALARDPQVLIADEPTSALDVVTQRAVLAKLREVQRRRGMSLVLITHDLRIAFSASDRVLVFYAGRILEAGAAATLDERPAHPYTLGLLASEPDPRRRGRLAGIPGNVPRAHEVERTCPFHARCAWAQDVCVAGAPPLAEVGPGHQTACVRFHAIRGELEAAHRRAAAEVDTPAPLAADAPTICAVAHAHKRFERSSLLRSRPAVVALEDVSFAVREGESVGLVGESGSGKTTIARCLVGLERLTAGTIEVDGLEVHEPERLARDARAAWRQAVQIVFQDPYSSLNPVRSVGWALKEAIACGAAAGGDADAEVARLLALVGLPASYADRLPRALSGGERQRISIARALATRPRLLICDEPVSALDVSVQAEVLALFRRLQRELGLAYLFITHDLAVLRQVAERVYVMHNGRVVEQGALDDVLERPQHAYTRRLIAATPRPQHDWLQDAEPAPPAAGA